MKKNILMLGTGHDQLIIIKKAIELGWGVIGFDGNPKAEGREFCDHFEEVDIRDPDLVEPLAIKYNKKAGIDACMAPATEMGISAGRVIDLLGLKGIGEEAAKALTIKSERRSLFRKARINQPKWTLKGFVNFVPFPSIIKPDNQMAAVGVRYIESLEQLEQAKDWNIREEYLEGKELSTEVLVFDPMFIAITADRNYDKKLKYKPYVLEDGCQLPTNISPKILSKIDNIIARIISELRLRHCAIKLDLLVKDNTVYVIECAPRLGGGELSSKMIQLAFGIDWWLLALKLACGITITQEELAPKHSQFVAQRYHFPPNPTSHKDRFDAVICTGSTYQEAIKRAENEIHRTSKP